jgi:CBS domain-containing protein
VPTLQHLAARSACLPRNLLGQGVQARQLTELISHLNDLLTERLLHLLCNGAAWISTQACWLAFGSEGRGEQTVATDQDNGLIFVSDDPDADRPALAGDGAGGQRRLGRLRLPACARAV